jgi:hypothetical protein
MICDDRSSSVSSDEVVRRYRRVQQSLFDVRYLLDSVVQKIKPLDWGTFWRKQTDKTQPLKVGAVHHCMLSLPSIIECYSMS